MPNIDTENTNDAAKKTLESESIGAPKANYDRYIVENDLYISGSIENPEEDITMYLDEFEISQLVMDSAIKNFEKSLSD